MVLSGWVPRGANVRFHPLEVYAQDGTLFTLQISHGGKFENFPGRQYVNGIVDYFDLVESDELSVHELNAMMNKLGYPNEEVMYYHFKIPGQDQVVVDMEKKTCTCRKWELSGMPCKHVVAVIWNMAENGEQAGIPEEWVSEVYWLDTWKKVYLNTIDPINGREFWTPSSCPTILTPPKHHTQIGRPKKKRKKSAEELAEISRSGKMTRKGASHTCRKCKEKGHNAKTCKSIPSQNVSQGGPSATQDV